MNEYDVVIVGGGIAGLTASAYLSRKGYKTLICEKDEKVGGLVSSFKVGDFTFDGGIRAIENSGIVLPMLKQLGLEVDFLESTVSIGVEDEVIKVESKESLKEYRNMFVNKFPENEKEIDEIMKEVVKVMKYLDILYGIDNPLFLDFKTNKKYFLTTILPWVFKYAFTFKKITKRSTPIDEYLQLFTDNQVLIDVIGQHFFMKTPAFFALSYFSLYLDYKYPKGGTGTLIKTIEDFIYANNGEIKTDSEIEYVDIENKVIKDKDNNSYKYKKMIWASDTRSLYKMIDIEKIKDEKVKQKVLERNDEVKDKKGGDSILAIYVGAELDKSFFKDKCTGHFFYTPYKIGLNKSFKEKETLDFNSKEEVVKWFKEYLKLTTYEVAIPSLRDDSLAPKGKTALVISTLMDYKVVKKIADAGWYDDFKKLAETEMVNILDQTIFKGFKDSISLIFSSTPLTIESRTNNTGGAITGWAFTNSSMPAVTSMPGIAKSVDTPIPNVYQAGQWSYSPSGLPISILTGKLASDKILKELKK